MASEERGSDDEYDFGSDKTDDEDNDDLGRPPDFGRSPKRESIVGSTGENKSQTSGGKNAQQLQTTSSIRNWRSVTFAWDAVNAHVEPPTRGLAGHCCPWMKANKEERSRQILQNVSGFARAGEVLAILGASGSGKTTLLNVLTFRNLRKLVVDGKVFANGKRVGAKEATAITGYVQQDHVFIGSLTVREILAFQARLKMGKKTPASLRTNRVENVIRELGLTNCADTVIGVPGRRKGISGGEMRRLAFACEILADPLILVCDEPTTGLDSYMAESVVTELKKQAEKRMTVITTIHQPASEVFALFDRISLMAEGRVAFSGRPADAAAFFSKVGYPCPAQYNPADHYIHTLAIVPGLEEECRLRVALIADSFAGSRLGRRARKFAAVGAVSDDAEAASGVSSTVDRKTRLSGAYRASWLSQFAAVTDRTWRSLRREPLVFRVRLFQTVLFGILMGLIYWQQRLDQQGVQNINGALFQMVMQTSMTNLFPVIHVFCEELPVFLREHSNGLYRTDAYFFGRTLAESPFYVLFPAMYATIIYFMIGFPVAAQQFSVFLVVVVLNATVAASFGYLISAATGRLPIALAVAPALFTPLILFGGFFLNATSGIIFLSWLRWVSWFNYSFQLLVVNFWSQVEAVHCPPSPHGNACQGFPSGKAVMDFFNFSPNYNLRNVVGLLALLLVFRSLALAFLILRARRR